jgi:hypothetical protein
MARYIVGCTLTSPGRDYLELAEAIAALGENWPCTRSMWVLTSGRTAAEIRDALKPHLGANDEMLVAELTGQAAWRVADGHFSEGLKRVFVQQRHT